MAERWDRDRLMYERDRLDDERFRLDDARFRLDDERFRRDDERFVRRGARDRDRSEERFDRRRAYDDDLVRSRRHYDDGPQPRRERPGPERPGPERPGPDRRVAVERHRERDYDRDASPRRPSFLRRQSSLDTFDRRPLRQFYERDEYPPPARREDLGRDGYRAPPYTPIPLPKTRALPPPRRYPDRGFYDDPNVADPDYYDDDYCPFPDRVRERELVRSHERRDRSRESRVSRSSLSSSRSSSSGGGTTVRSEYPKKGKTKIPARLVSKRALIDLGYPFIQEDNTIIVQKALGQDNIDQLLKLSDDYNKADLEMAADKVGERKALLPPVRLPAAPQPPPPPAPVVIPPPPPAPVAAPVAAPALPPAFPPPPAEVVERSKTVIRELSPAHTTTTSTSSWDSHHHRHHDELIVGPLIERSRSRSRSRKEIRAEIRALERELAHRPKGELGEREIVRTQRLPDGEIVIYQERTERQVAGPKPPRIEKDKKGPPPRLVRAMLTTLT